ncbi:MAG TPA: DUF2258 domain-containing protein [Geobacterales bacterium]|nr:DUF2258 domain-containing protein [Geobacterales bacterium]
MPTLNIGTIIAGAYADKVRRTLFAVTRPLQTSGQIKSEEVAYAAAQLNQTLYKIIVEKLKVDKGDVVRILVDFDVKEGKIEWKLDTLKIEWYVKKDQSFVDQAIKEVVGTEKN